TVEEHSVIGGLGSAVLETLSDRITGALPPLKRLGIPDKFAEHYGSQQKLMEDCGFDAKSIDQAVRKRLAELRR
ncbi:MAG TPA: transketolase C-terminal domain-containing protein, partial [Reyranella sp.]|nr:transketolase C-terminal domain-containing protein [Reyranella sp.]